MTLSFLTRSLRSIRRRIQTWILHGLGGVSRSDARAAERAIRGELADVRDALLHEIRSGHQAVCRRADRLEELTERLRQGAGETHAWLQSFSSAIGPVSAPETPDQALVSVVMPVWNRASVVGRAIRSVRQQTWTNWELLIVDDGSTDATADAVAPFLTDPRIRWIPRSHAGVCAARNHALTLSRGEWIAYLDSDNVWLPHHLAQIVGALQTSTDARSAYSAQLVTNHTAGVSFIRGRSFDAAWFADHGGIDLNAFVHHRSCFEALGGFDERLTRLVDWDLVGRYARSAPPLFVPCISVLYEEARPDSISVRESFSDNELLVRQRLQQDSAPEALPPGVSTAPSDTGASETDAPDASPHRAA